MNKILVEVSIGELLDKISILEIKQEKIKDAEKLKYIHDEYKVLKEQLSINVKSDDKLNELFRSLKEINSNKKYWLTSAVRTELLIESESKRVVETFSVSKMLYVWSN